MVKEYEDLEEFRYTYRYVLPDNVLDGEEFSVLALNEEEAFSLARERTDRVSTRIKLRLVSTESTGRMRRHYLRTG